MKKKHSEKSRVARDLGPQSTDRDRIFICYDRVDFTYLEMIDKALEAYDIVPAKKVLWYDKKDLVFGQEFKRKITDAIEQSCIAICLVSNSFYGSEFIKNDELPHIIGAVEKQELEICPVHVSSYSEFSNSLLGKYQSVNDHSRPLDMISNPGELRREVDEIVRKIAHRWVHLTKGAPKPSANDGAVSTIGFATVIETPATPILSVQKSGPEECRQTKEAERDYPEMHPLPDYIVEGILGQLNREKADDIDVARFFSDDKHRLLKDCVLLAKARHYYMEGKRHAMDDQWPKSITKHLFAYTFFSSLERKHYGHLASRSAGRLAWGLLMNANPRAAKFYLHEAEECDQLQAAGNYFWAIQYALRMNNVEEAKYLAERFVHIGLQLHMNSGECDGVDYSDVTEQYAIAFVRQCYLLIKDDDRAKRQLSAKKDEQATIHSSDAGKFELMTAQLLQAQNKTDDAILSYRKAAEIFESNSLHSYSKLCDLYAVLLEVRTAELRKKQEKLRDATSLFEDTRTSVSLRQHVISVLAQVASINITFIDALKRSQSMKTVLAQLETCYTSLDNCHEQLLIDMRQSIIDITRLTKNLLTDYNEAFADTDAIDKILNAYYSLYMSVPYLLERYEPILLEVLSKKLKSSNIQVI